MLVHTERNSPRKSENNVVFVVEFKELRQRLMCIADKEEVHFERK